MTSFIIGLVVFLGIHSISIFAPGWRERMAQKLGDNAWKAIYGLISLGSFVVMIWGYSDARMAATVVYTPPVWGRHLTMLLMLPVFPLLFAAYLPGRIQRWTVHPMLIATALWGIAHLLANGTNVDLMLFGGFALWAVVDIISLRRRNAAPIKPAMTSKWNDLIAIIGGLALYAAFVGGLHGWLTGMPLMPSA